MRTHLRILAAGFAALATGVSADSMRVVPSPARAGEDFAISITANRVCGKPLSTYKEAYVEPGSMQRVIAVTARFRDDSECGFNLANQRVEVVMKVAAAGAYRVDFQQVKSTSVKPINVLGTANVANEVPASSPSYHGLGGLWWDPARPGRGLDLAQGETGALFAFWYTYGEDGLGTWLSMSSGRWISGTEFRGLVFRANRDFSGSEPVLTPYTSLVVRALSTDRIELVFDGGEVERLERFRF